MHNMNIPKLLSVKTQKPGLTSQKNLDSSFNNSYDNVHFRIDKLTRGIPRISYDNIT